jgi:chromosome segregation ATPase
MHRNGNQSNSYNNWDDEDEDYYDQEGYDPENEEEEDEDENFCNNCQTLEDKLDFRNKLYGKVAQSLGEERKRVSELENEVSELKDEVSNLKDKLSDSKRKKVSWKKFKSVLSQLNQAKTEIDEQVTKIDNQKSTINQLLNRQSELKEEIKEFKDKSYIYSTAYHSVLAQNNSYISSFLGMNSQSSSSSKFDDLMAQLKTLVQCPITLEPMINPVFSPSGNTLDESAMKKLIQTKEVDPFTRKGECCTLTPNYLAKQLIDILTKFK